MTTRRFGEQLAMAALFAAIVTMPMVSAQDEPAPAAAENKPGSLIKPGDMLSGELNSLRGRRDPKGKRSATYQLTSEPHRLPPPGGLCNLETGPETFQIVANSDADAAKLKALVGKDVSLKVEEISCAQDAGQMSEAIVTKWSAVSKR
jgi:hypothetical protein